MVLPLIGNLVKGFTTLKKTTGKFSAAKRFVTGKKKYKKSGTGIEQGDGPNQQVGDDTKVAESIPKEKMVSGIKIPTYKPSNKTIETSGKTSFESVSQTLDKIKETTDSLVKVSESELDVEKDKQDALERRRDKQKADERERRLESKGKKISIPGIGLSAKAGSSIFDFFANILLGSLVVFLLNNVDKIENLFKTLKENFENPFKLMKSVIQGISIAFGKPIGSFFKGAFNVLKKSGSGIKNLVKRITPKLTRTFKNLGSSIVNTVKNIVKSTKNTVTRSTGSAIARSTARAASAGAGQAAARGGAKAVSKPSGPKPAPKPKAGANRIFGQKGVKRLLKFRNVFKSAAVVGSLISLVIDLILGEPLDSAAVGAVGGLIGGVLGSMAGGALGFAVGSVVPIAGNLIGAGAGKIIGGILGSMVGDTIAKKLYENFKNNLSQVNIGKTAVADSMTWRNIFGVNEPWTPPEGGPSAPDYQPGQETPSYIPGATSTPSGGGADFWSVAAISSVESGHPQGRADVAQSIYNRKKAGTKYGYPGASTYNGLITHGDQYQPVREGDRNLWKAIKDRNSAIAAVASVNRGNGPIGITMATMLVDSASKDITNPSLVKSAREWVGGRTDFAQPGAANKYPGGLGFRTRHGHLFGWYVGPGAIKYGKSPEAQVPVPGPNQQQTPSQLTPQPAQVTTPPPQSTSGIIEKMGKTTGGKKGDTISGFPVTSGYGKRGGGTHGGIDIGTPVGTYVALSVDVEILYSTIQGGTGSGYGNVIDAWAPSLGVQFRLAHLSKRLVSQGQKVPAGVPLGITGGAKGDKGSGSSTGPHLHFEVDNIKGSARYGGMGDPSPYIGYVILSSSAPSGESKPITGQVISQPAERQYTDIQRQAPYDQRQGGNNVIMVPVGGGQMRGGGGGSYGSMVIGSSTQAVLNSYYKSQLLGFLYKQG